MSILGSELCDREENKKSRDAPLPDNGTGGGQEDGQRCRVRCHVMFRPSVCCLKVGKG